MLKIYSMLPCNHDKQHVLFLRTQVLASIKARTSNVSKPFVVGSCAEDGGALGGQEHVEFEDDGKATKRKPRLKQKLTASKSKKKKRKARRVLRASSENHAACHSAASSTVTADAPTPLCSAAKKSDASSKLGPNYEPKKYMAAYKLFLVEKKLAGLNRAEAIEGWHSSDIKNKFLEGMSYSEMKRRRFIRG